jgi:hypothetical protein
MDLGETGWCGMDKNAFRVNDVKTRESEVLNDTTFRSSHC